MKAIGFTASLAITEEKSLFEFEQQKPEAKGHDLLIKIKAISVNPVDYKIRANSAVNTILDKPKVIGWDASGIVEEVGDEVTLFHIGDEVFYAGDVTRDGCYAEYQVVDERIVGHKPQTCSFVEAAAMPLTSITAYESLFERIKLNPIDDMGKSILIISGAGGVGSIATQLAKQIGHLKVISTSSRPETKEWCLKMGADYVVNHHHLEEELKEIGYEEVDYILDYFNIEMYWEIASRIIKPQGHVLTVTESKKPLDFNLFKMKSVSISWEFMYTRSMFHTPDMVKQHELLDKISFLLDEKILQTTLYKTLHGFTADNLKAAHQLLESGTSIGKIVVEY